MKKFPNLDEGFAEQLRHLQEPHPYCPLFSILLARLEQDAGTGENVALHRAAIFTADRVHLRELLGIGLNGREVAHIDYAELIMESMAELKKSQAAFEAIAFAESASVETEALSASVKKERKPRKGEEHTESPEAANTEESAPKTASRSARKSTDPGEVLLQEIKSSHHKQKPENPKQQEQLDIIDLFIKGKPSSRPPAARPEKQGIGKEDLSQSNDQYSENVISETLVEILIRQGKREKAIQVLKKLIWKFPQKKALFAARIQELSQ